MISCCNWWPWTKPGYVTMNRRQSNNQWSCGIATHNSSTSSECKNPLEKFLPLFFCDQDGILLIDYVPKGQTINAEYCSSLLVQLKDILKENNAGCRKVTKGFLFCTTMPRLTVHLQHKRNWPTWASSVLITHSIFWIWPCRTTSCSLDWKRQLKGRHFSSDAEVIAAAETWLEDILLNFFEWLAEVRAMG